MSLISVKEDLAQRAPNLHIIESEGLTPTVETAAIEHGVMPGQIAKTLAFWVQGQAILVVASGDVRIDSKKFKQQFGVKIKMLKHDEVLEITTHPVGGVCPFGLPQPLPIYLDQSLLSYDVIMPAAGSINSAVKITTGQLGELTDGVWVDLS